MNLTFSARGASSSCEGASGAAGLRGTAARGGRPSSPDAWPAPVVDVSVPLSASGFGAEEVGA